MNLSQSRYNVREINIYYKTIKGKINEPLDRQITKFANSYGLEFIGSGYNFEMEERDLQFKAIFEKPIIN